MPLSSTVPRAAFALVLSASILGPPPADALVAGNGVEASASASPSAIAACQVLVLVDVVIILDVEDALSLATARSPVPASVVVPGLSGPAGAASKCRVRVGDILVEKADGARARRDTYISGAPPVGEDVVASGSAWNVKLAGSASAAATCQAVALVGSVIIGGGAFGMPGGLSGPVVHGIAAPSSADGAETACEASIDEEGLS